MEWKDRHGWKWIGASQSGVLALFAAHPSPSSDAQDNKLPKEPSLASPRPPEATQSDVNALPLALRSVLLGIEIVLSLAVGLLCVWCATITRTIVRTAVGGGGSLLAEIAYTAVVTGGLVAFFARIFQQHNQSRMFLLKRLGLFRTPLSEVIGSLVISMLCLVLLGRGRDRHELHINDALSLRRVLLAPFEEELFFRALVGHLALHRLRGQRLASAAVASAGFALVHLANARRLVGGDGSTLGGLFVQIGWAVVVGMYLSLRYTRTGSLLECVLLHVVNNAFAALASSSSTLGSTKPQGTLVAILSIVVYALASLREWRIAEQV